MGKSLRITKSIAADAECFLVNLQYPMCKTTYFQDQHSVVVD